MALERELAYFKHQLPELLKHYEGQHALVKGEELRGTYTTLEEAFDAGVNKLGNQEFLIKEITETDLVVSFPAAYPRAA